MKGLVLAFAIMSVFMLLLGCTQFGVKLPPLPEEKAQPEGKPTTPAEPIGGTKEVPVKPATPPEGGAQVPKSMPAWPEGQEPLNGSSVDNGSVEGNYTVSEELPTVEMPKTIAGICLNEVVEAWCSASTYVSYQVLNTAGMSTGYAKTVVAFYNNENVTANCTVQFVRIPPGGIPQYTNYTAVLGPHETSQNFTLTSPNGYEEREDFFGSMVQKVCRPYQ